MESKEADHLLEHHRQFANSGAFIHVAIALGAVGALTRNRLIWMGSMLLGVVGAGVFIVTLVR